MFKSFLIIRRPLVIQTLPVESYLGGLHSLFIQPSDLSEYKHTQICWFPGVTQGTTSYHNGNASLQKYGLAHSQSSLYIIAVLALCTKVYRP